MNIRVQHFLWFLVWTFVTAVSIYLTLNPEVIGGYVWLLVPFPALLALKELANTFSDDKEEEEEEEQQLEEEEKEY